MVENAMMAMVVASTAFAGLTAVVIGQIRESETRAIWKNTKGLLIATGGLGILVPVLAVLWFFLLHQWDSAAMIIYLLFILQMFFFWGAAVSFWSAKQ